MSYRRGQRPQRGGGNFQRNNRNDGAGFSNIRGRIGNAANRGGNRGGGQRGPMDHRQFLQRVLNPTRGGRGNFRGGRGRGGIPSTGNQFAPLSRTVAVNDENWSKIQIPNGKTFGRNFLAKELSAYVQGGKFHPILFRFTDSGDATFFLDDPDVVEAVKAASRRIVGPDNLKVIITCASCNAPFVPLGTDEVEVLKTLLQQRFDAMNEHLNLSRFGEDPLIRGHSTHMAFNRNNVIMAIVSLLGDACPNLRSIDISFNNVRFMDYFSNLTFRCPRVKRVNLSNNNIENMSEVEKLSSWELEELSLEGNPVCKIYRDASRYISDIRSMFSKLVRLDGKELPAAFRTGIEDDLTVVKMPHLRGSFYVNEDYEKICRRFIEAYFTVFDNPDLKTRESLYNAYDNDAVFTLSAENLSSEAHRAKSKSWPEFVKDSHNITRMHIWENHRSKMVHSGRLAIISFFVNNYPLTQHDPSSFVMDISFATNSLMCLNVSGIYKEATAASNDSSRFFTRIFLLVPTDNPNANGVCVINEELFVSTMPGPQEIHYRSNMEQMQSSSSLIPQQQPTATIVDLTAAPAASSVTSTPPFSVVPDIFNQGSNASNSRSNSIEKLSQLSGMKSEWSEKCLEDCDWNLEKAYNTFIEIRQQGIIPPSAFVGM